MTHDADRDLFIVSMRLVALVSGFYLLCGASLSLLRILYTYTNDDESRGHHSHSYITQAFGSFKAIAWNGVLLPSIVWVFAQRVLIATGMTILVASIVDVFRSVVDYVVSTYVIHVVISICVIGGFPGSVLWWCIVVCECALVVVVSEWLIAKKQRLSIMRTVRRIEDEDHDPGGCDV